MANTIPLDCRWRKSGDGEFTGVVGSRLVREACDRSCSLACGLYVKLSPKALKLKDNIVDVSTFFCTSVCQGKIHIGVSTVLQEELSYKAGLASRSN